MTILSSLNWLCLSIRSRFLIDTRHYPVLVWSRGGRTQNLRHRKVYFSKYVFFRWSHDKGIANHSFILGKLDKDSNVDNVLHFVHFLDKEQIQNLQIGHHYSVAFQSKTRVTSIMQVNKTPSLVELSRKRVLGLIPQSASAEEEFRSIEPRMQQIIFPELRKQIWKLHTDFRKLEDIEKRGPWIDNHFLLKNSIKASNAESYKLENFQIKSSVEGSKSENEESGQVPNLGEWQYTIPEREPAKWSIHNEVYWDENDLVLTPPYEDLSPSSSYQHLPHESSEPWLTTSCFSGLISPELLFY